MKEMKELLETMRAEAEQTARVAKRVAREHIHQAMVQDAIRLRAEERITAYGHPDQYKRVSNSAWPPVGAQDWCGEFQAKEKDPPT